MEVTTLPDGTQVAEFQFDFALDAKAMDSIVSNDDGSLLIEGYASDFDVDRQGEAFEPDAFENGLQKYLDTNPVLLYHHKADTALGQVVDAKIDSKGMFIKARVDEPEPGTMVADYFRKIKNGTLRGFSVGGIFKRRMTANGPRIFDVDLGEISVTPYPVNPRMLFAVAGKAFEGIEIKEEPDTVAIEAALARIDSNLTQAEGKASAHPDAHKLAALLYHQQQVHTLAEDTSQNAEKDEVKQSAKAIAKSAKEHSATLHKLAVKIGPLPHYYGSL